MNTFEQELKRHTASIRLTDEEKSRMRGALLAHMQAYNPRKPVLSPWMSFIRTPRVLAFAVAVLCLVGGGSAYAAQSALPGDVLYPVKINVNEGLEVALATTPLEQIQVQSHLADTRIEEAQTLSDRGTLTASTTASLEESFTEHATAAITLSEAISPPSLVSATTSEPATGAVETNAVPLANTTEGTSTSSTTIRTMGAMSMRVPAVPMTPKNVKTATSTPVRVDSAFTSQLKASLGIQASILESLKAKDTASSTTQHATSTLMHTSKKIYAPPHPTSTSSSSASGTTSVSSGSSVSVPAPSTTTTSSASSSTGTRIILPSSTTNSSVKNTTTGSGSNTSSSASSVSSGSGTSISGSTHSVTSVVTHALGL